MQIVNPSAFCVAAFAIQKIVHNLDFTSIQFYISNRAQALSFRHGAPILVTLRHNFAVRLQQNEREKQTARNAIFSIHIFDSVSFRLLIRNVQSFNSHDYRFRIGSLCHLGCARLTGVVDV